METDLSDGRYNANVQHSHLRTLKMERILTGRFLTRPGKHPHPASHINSPLDYIHAVSHCSTEIYIMK